MFTDNQAIYWVKEPHPKEDIKPFFININEWMILLSVIMPHGFTKCHHHVCFMLNVIMLSVFDYCHFA
jgi:hypothetical protein